MAQMRAAARLERRHDASEHTRWAAAAPERAFSREVTWHAANLSAAPERVRVACAAASVREQRSAMAPRRGLKASGGNVAEASEAPAASPAKAAAGATAAKLQQLYEDGKENAVRARAAPRAGTRPAGFRCPMH
jgi:hypothetical protein